MTRSALTPLALENLRRAAVATARGESIIARDHGDRPSLAALHARGLVQRRPRRVARNIADNAWAYRITVAGLRELEAESNRLYQASVAGATERAS